MKPVMKTPISYYGGKQRMLPKILPKIPDHTVYVEPFFGGGAVFWGKQPTSFEVVNDNNGRLISFYKALKYDFEQLASLVDETFHSRQQYQESKTEYLGSKDVIQDPLACAWAVWVQANLSFAKKMAGSFGYDRAGACPRQIANKKAAFTEAYQQRMRHVTIESYDALKVIKTYDSPNTFFYLDPPYVSSDQGHYKGYTAEDFNALLQACATIQGKFLLSSYPEPALIEARKKFGWKTEDHRRKVAVDGKKANPKEKVECLTWNY